MSGFAGDGNDGEGFAHVGAQAQIGRGLLDILMSDAIVPGSPASYELCKKIFAYHPLGLKLADTPVALAQSQERDITVPSGPETRLVEAFRREWKALKATRWIRNLIRTSRIYGIACVVIGDRKNPENNAKPLKIDTLWDDDIYFSVFDPLNTAGSLTLEQDPTSPDFQKPRQIVVSGRPFHSSRVVVLLNEDPVYIEWTNSAFGFVGRSVYQRGLFALKTFIQTMITDEAVAKKVGLLIWNADQPGPITNNRILDFFGFKRQQLKGGTTGQVLTIPLNDKIESVNLQNLEGPQRLVRDNSLKNVAMSASMPSKLLEQETMVGGMAEGQEDAKAIAQYIGTVRDDAEPAYTFFDMIIMRRAWSPPFYETIQADFSEWADVPYDTAFYRWKNSFQAKWPNLLAEPESEKMKSEEIRFKSAVALLDSMSPLMDPKNKASLVAWVADEVNSRRDLFSAPLHIDEDALAAYTPPATVDPEGKEPSVEPFSGQT
jgi:hypothetical protein